MRKIPHLLDISETENLSPITSGGASYWLLGALDLNMLKGIEVTSRQTVNLILGIKDLMLYQKHKLRSELPKIYSQDLLNNFFRHSYTKIDFVMQELQIHRNTAVKYLEEIVRIGLLAKHKTSLQTCMPGFYKLKSAVKNPPQKSPKVNTPTQGVALGFYLLALSG